MADISHMIGADLALSDAGDLATVDSDAWTQQRVLRRLLTNTGDYIWQLSYGGSLPAMIGLPISAQRVVAVIRQQMLLESAVAQQPEPIVSVQTDQRSTVFATITYFDSASGTEQNLSVPGST